MKVNGVKSGSLRSIKAGASQYKDFKAMLLRMDHILELQESGELVVGQWCNWIVMENWDLGVGCIGSMDAELEVLCTTKEGGADGLPVLSQESCWPHQGACRQRRNY